MFKTRCVSFCVKMCGVNEAAGLFWTVCLTACSLTIDRTKNALNHVLTPSGLGYDPKHLHGRGGHRGSEPQTPFQPCSWNLVAPPFDLQERKIHLKLRWELNHQPLVLIHLLPAPFSWLYAHLHIGNRTLKPKCVSAVL